MRAVNLAHDVTSGNPALLLKMANMAEGSSFMQVVLKGLNLYLFSLYKLAKNVSIKGISSIDIVSSYRFKNLHTTLSHSVMRLTEDDKNALECIAVMPPEKWIPLEAWEIVIPVDVNEMGDMQYEVVNRY